ncbi:hypothetical protein [Actinomadura sp. 3N508]|uniref:hypothetical protein n=1 Tax=Actinomadura sp. 3N508 TaxID=3375153 RepID=UPI0037A4201D
MAGTAPMGRAVIADAHLSTCTHDEDTDELLFGADYDAAEAFHSRLWEPAGWTGGLARLHHPARDDGHFMGPALSWPELTAADGSLPGGSTSDPDARLLLLLPCLGDEAVAAAILGGCQGQCGPVEWTAVTEGVRVNTGGYSFRDPANGFALPQAWLARVAGALGT